MLLKELVFKTEINTCVRVMEDQRTVFEGKLGDMLYRLIKQYEVVGINTQVRGMLDDAYAEIIIHVKTV